MVGAILQTDTDYWLLSDAGVGISDMWRSDRILASNVGREVWGLGPVQTAGASVPCAVPVHVCLFVCMFEWPKLWVPFQPCALESVFSASACTLTCHHPSFERHVGRGCATERRVRTGEHRVATRSHPAV
jgi:hypothetical protein